MQFVIGLPILGIILKLGLVEKWDRGDRNLVWIKTRRFELVFLENAAVVGGITRKDLLAPLSGSARASPASRRIRSRPTLP